MFFRERKCEEMSEFDNSNTSSNDSGTPGYTLDPMQAVKGPALFLLVVGILSVIGSLVNLLVNALGTTMSLVEESTASGLLTGGIGILFSIIGIGGAVLIISGSLKMKKLENYKLGA